MLNMNNKQVKNLPSALFITQRALMNGAKTFQQTSSAALYFSRPGANWCAISLTTIKNFLTGYTITFSKRFGNYLYIKNTNYAILNPEVYCDVRWSLTNWWPQGGNIESLTMSRDGQNNFVLHVYEDYEYVRYTRAHMNQLWFIIESNFLKALPIAQLLSARERAVCVRAISCIETEEEWERFNLEVLRMLSIPLSDVSKRRPTMLHRYKMLRYGVSQLSRSKNLPVEIAQDILRRALFMETVSSAITNAWFDQDNPFRGNTYAACIEWQFTEEEHDLSKLLLRCGDVELNPGPSLYWVLLPFVLVLTLLNLVWMYSYSQIMTLLVVIYYFYRFLFKYLEIHILSKRWWYKTVDYFTPSYGQDWPYTVGEVLKDGWTPTKYYLLMAWLLIWAFVPCSYAINWILNSIGIFLPEVVVKILIPILVMTFGGVDVTDPEFYIFTKPGKYNYIVSVLMPYTIAWVYFFSLEVSWISIPYLYSVYVASMIVFCLDLIIYGLVLKNDKHKKYAFCFVLLIPFIPSSRTNFYLKLLAMPIFIGSKIYLTPFFYNKGKRHNKSKWNKEMIADVVGSHVLLSLQILKRIKSIASAIVLWQLVRVDWVGLFYTLLDALVILMLVVWFSALLIHTSNKHHKQEEAKKLWVLKRHSYFWMDRGRKVLGGWDEPFGQVEYGEVINNFEDMSELPNRHVNHFYTPNFSQFLDWADREIERTVLSDEVARLKLLLEEDLAKNKPPSSYKKYFSIAQGKVLQQVHIITQFLKSKRVKSKPVWMTNVQIVKLRRISLRKYVSKAREILPRGKKYVMEPLSNSISKAKEIWGITDTKDRFLRPSGKPCKQEPLLQELANEWKTQGANSFKYNSEMYIKSSISRYFEKPTRLEGTNKEAIKLAAEALVHHNPKLYGNAQLWSPEQILKKTVLKYSCQFPLTNNPMWKSKRDVIKNLGKPEVLRVIADYIRSGHYFRSLHTVFLKLAVVNRPKIELNPGKQRTITAQDWLNYSLGMFVCGSVNKRFDFESNSAPFTPILTGGLVRLATRLMKHKYFACMDFTAADSYFSSLIEGILEVRKIGYSDNADFDDIANVLEAYYDGLEKSVIINREQGRKYWKMRGLSTGHANTTPDNTIAEQLAMLMAWHHLTKRPFHEYYIYNDQPAYGDDNILGTSYSDLKTWNATNIAKYITEELGIPCRVEWEGNSLNGATFLAKRFCTDERILQELIDYGIRTPVAIIQDEEKLRQNFVVNLKNPNPKYIWNYTIGYLLQTASLPHLYKEIRSYLDTYMKDVPLEMIKSFEKQQKIPSYDQVMKLTYANKQQRKLGWVDLHPVLPSKILDVYRKGYGHIAGQLQIFENLTNTLRQFIPDAPEDHTKPIQIKRSVSNLDPEDFLLEAFIYYKADGPDPTFFRELCATSPYSSLLQPQVFLENIEIILPYIPLSEALTIPNIMTGIFFFMNSSMNFYLNPFSWLQYLNKKISMFYLEANYFWWTQTGRSSFTLSKLIPKDPAYYEKRFTYKVAKTVRHCLPNLYMNIKPYEADMFMSDFVITVPDAPRKFNEHWDSAMPDVISMLAKHKKITLKARTASGKTYFLPQILKDYFPYITILTVNNTLVQSNSTPGFSKVTYKKKEMLDAKYRVLTYGLWEALKCKPRTGEILLLDEFAERDEAIYYAIRTNGEYQIAMSATPRVQGLPEYPFYEVVVPRVHQIHRLNCHDLEEAIGKFQDLGLSRFMVINPNIRKNQELAMSLTKTGLPTQAVYSGSGPIPETGNLIATTIVDSGVDIGDLDMVIDYGKSLKLVKGQLTLVDSNESVIEQRMGRVGRRKEGWYVSLNQQSATKDFSKECSVWNAMFKPSVSEHFNVKSPVLTDIDEPLPPVFLMMNEEIQNTVNLAFYSLKSSRRREDAVKIFNDIIHGRENKYGTYIIGKYSFKKMLFSEALHLINITPHRFAVDRENDFYYDGSSFTFTRVEHEI